MEKTEIIEFFGSIDDAASALGVGKSAIYALPASIPSKMADRVLGAAIRLYGTRETRRWWPDLVQA